MTSPPNTNAPPRVYVTVRGVKWILPLRSFAVVDLSEDGIKWAYVYGDGDIEVVVPQK